jgi:protein tyrosine/serine phosphatase
MARFIPALLGSLLAALLLGGTAGYAYYRQTNYRNFRVVKEGVLYRSGQLSRAGLERVLHDYGIKTVISLRDAATPGEPPPDRAEEEFCKAQEVPALQGVRRFLKVLDNPDNYPVLVHCFAGIHRTGAYCAVYRMEYEGWTTDRAIAEVKACGYTNLDDEWDILGFLEQYQPRVRTTLHEGHEETQRKGN